MNPKCLKCVFLKDLEELQKVMKKLEKDKKCGCPDCLPKNIICTGCFNFATIQKENKFKEK